MKKKQNEAKGCSCPYCEAEVATDLSPFCQACGLVLRYCEKCRVPVKKEAKVCPQCGGPLKTRAKA